MSDLRLLHPTWLLASIPVVVATVVAIRQQRRSAVVYSSARLLEALPVTLAQRCKRLLPWLRLTGLLFVVIALARPQHGLQEFRVQTEGIAIMMCLDRSGSMKALDFRLDDRQVNRLEAVKRVFSEFVGGTGELAGRPNDQIGLISFGGFAESNAPLTLDHVALLQVLEDVEIPEPIRDAQGKMINGAFIQEELATAIGDALTLAVDRLRDVEAKSKVIILLSDGENTAGVIDPADAAEAAKSLGIKIYSIGVGTSGFAPIPSIDAFGRPELKQARVKLDEATLKQLAKATDGLYFKAEDTESLQQVYAAIDELEKTELEGTLYTDYRELFQWLLLPGIALVLLERCLSWTRFRSLP